MKQYWAEVYDSTACRTVTRVYRKPEPERLEYSFGEDGFVFSPALEGHDLMLSWTVQDAVTWEQELEQFARHVSRHFAPAGAPKELLRPFYERRDYEPQVDKMVNPMDGGYTVPREFVAALKLEEVIYKEVQVPMYANGYPTCYFPPLTKQLLDAEAAHEEARWDRLRRRYERKHDPAASRQRYRDHLRRIGAPYFADLDKVSELLEDANGKEN